MLVSGLPDSKPVLHVHWAHCYSARGSEWDGGAERRLASISASACGSTSASASGAAGGQPDDNWRVCGARDASSQQRDASRLRAAIARRERRDMSQLQLQWEMRDEREFNMSHTSTSTSVGDERRARVDPLVKSCTRNCVHEFSTVIVALCSQIAAAHIFASLNATARLFSSFYT